MGRYVKSPSDSNDPSLKWIALWIGWLVIFLGVLPAIMQCNDPTCATINPNSLLVLWFDVMTLFGVVTYLQMVFGLWVFLIVLGCWDMMS